MDKRKRSISPLQQQSGRMEGHVNFDYLEKTISLIRGSRMHKAYLKRWLSRREVMKRTAKAKRKGIPIFVKEKSEQI